MLGYENAAAYVLDDQMAKTPEAAMRLLHQVGEHAAAKARHDAARLQSMIDAAGERFVLAPWDWQLYAERLRKAEYELDESQIKPYFELDRVLRDGVFFAANRLYGIELVEREGIPVYHPEVRVFDVLDADGSPLALFYADFFKRDNKVGGAWMDMFADQSRLLNSRAIVYNVTNFTKPAPGQPALLTFDEVATLFHEFGHALHGMLSNVEYPMLSGANVPRDFVEFPSQFNEHWALDETVFARYARHHLTDEPMPAALVDRIKRSRTFNQGFALTEYVSAALLDMAWHLQRPGRSVGGGTSMRSSATSCASTAWRWPRFPRATIRRTSRTRGTAGTAPATTRIFGPKCWITTRTTGSGLTAACRARPDSDFARWCCRAAERRIRRSSTGRSSAETRASSRCWRSADSLRPRCDRHE